MQFRMDAWYRLCKLAIGTYLAIFISKIRVVGVNRLCPGPKIIMANHANLTDGFVLAFVIREKLHYLIQSEAFEVPILRYLLKEAEQIPLERGRGQDALSRALEKLSAGNAVAVFSEGRLNPLYLPR